MATRILVFAAIAGMAAAPSSAQVSMRGSTGGSFSGTASFGPAHSMGPLVKGAPYSGEEVTENVKVLTDGTRITQKMAGRKVWRDSEGRMRSERPLGMGPNQTSTPVIIEISDPVAGFKYTLDTQNKVAHRQAMPAMPAQGFNGGMVGSSAMPRGGMISAPPQAAGPGGGGGGRAGSMGVIVPMPMPAPMQADPQMRPRFANESIGTQSIEGVMVEGTRNTVTFPVGMMGNDREFSTVTESWMSPELKIQILSKTNDPRNGESTFRIANLSRTPPDPMLFLPPADYRVVEESGPFTIQWGRSAQ
jgi:hypothetical protein